jgi:hypothetical protein
MVSKSMVSVREWDSMMLSREQDSKPAVIMRIVKFRSESLSIHRLFINLNLSRGSFLCSDRYHEPSALI